MYYGSEFVQHEKIGRALDAKTYFAHPYSSWERPINENTNGLIRQFFPKKTDFKKVTWHQVKVAIENLNICTAFMKNCTFDLNSRTTFKFVMNRSVIFVLLYCISFFSLNSFGIRFCGH